MNAATERSALPPDLARLLAEKDAEIAALREAIRAARAEAEMPRELARLLERLAEVKADCDRAERTIRFCPFTGEGVQT